ncbi:MAG: cobalamin-dependent protein [Lachnospiraceae bacterium]|nr:cobalamin-dependent protein [Lachnospiraceae bacterium]
MPQDREKLITSFVQLNLKAVLENTDTLLSQGVPGEEIIALLQRGMDLVNRSCRIGEYFIADLIMANNIYREALDRITRGRMLPGSGVIGKVLMGTVQGDIHDIGKNLIALLLRNSGFEVVDLGTSISPEQFSAAVMTHAPNLLIISGSISGSEIMMARTIEVIEEAGIRSAVSIILGGNCIDERLALMIGADAYSRDILDCVGLCRRIMLGEV